MFVGIRSIAVKFLLNKASEAEIAEHLLNCDTDFVPPLSERVDVADYAKKIAQKALRIEAWSGRTLVGIVAVYCNDQATCIAYITSVSVLKDWTGEGVATQLLDQCVRHVQEMGMQQIRLEVTSENLPAIKLYEKRGFSVENVNELVVSMRLLIESGEKHDQ